MPTYTKHGRLPDNIRDYDTIESLFGENDPEDPRVHLKIKEDPVHKKFNEWTKKLHFIGTNNNIPVSEIFKLINVVFSYSWDTIPFGKYDEVYNFVKANSEYRYKWIDPLLHEYLMKTKYYQTSSTLVDKKATQIFCSNIFSMMENERPKEEFYQLGIEILNR